MPRITYHPPAATRATFSPQERTIMRLLLALVNEVREELGLPPRTVDEAIALVQTQKEGI